MDLSHLTGRATPGGASGRALRSTCATAARDDTVRRKRREFHVTREAGSAARGETHAPGRENPPAARDLQNPPEPCGTLQNPPQDALCSSPLT